MTQNIADRRANKNDPINRGLDNIKTGFGGTGPSLGSLVDKGIQQATVGEIQARRNRSVQPLGGAPRSRSRFGGTAPGSSQGSRYSDLRKRLAARNQRSAASSYGWSR